MVVKKIDSAEEYKKLLQENQDKLIVIDFFATWCGPCVMIAPVMEQYSEEYKDVIFIKIDVDELSETAQKCRVSAMPTFHFMRKGEKVDELVGASKEKLKELIEKNMQTS